MSFWFDDDHLPEIPGDILAQLTAKGDAGDIGDSSRSAVQRVVAINQQLLERVRKLEDDLHQSNTHLDSMRQQVIGLVQVTRRLGYEPSTKPPSPQTTQSPAKATVSRLR